MANVRYPAIQYNNSQASTLYNAGPGYDLASGVGTVDAAKIVRALVEDEGEDAVD